MATTPTSRASLADLISMISRADLPNRQKQELTSAVRTVARVIGSQPEQIPADPSALRRRLDEVAPEASGISRGRWANVRSLLTKALALTRPMLPGRSLQPILPAWAAMMAALSTKRRKSLGPLTRFLSARGFSPRDVTLEDLLAYRDAMLGERLRRRPELTWDLLIWNWNFCMREVAGWPQIEIARQSRKETYVLPWSTFPESFKADVDAYLDRLSGRDLSDDGPPRPARPSTLATREHQMRVCASALVHRGVDAATIRSIGDLVVLNHYQEILRFFLDRNDGQTSSQIGQIAGVLKDVARHWVKIEDEALAKMKRIVGRLAQHNHGMTAKNRSRLRPLDDPETVRLFLSIPERIRADVEKDKRPPDLKAVQAQMAAAIAILQAAPIRRKNLAALDVREHLIDRGGKLYLIIAGEDVKNHEPVDFELPPHAANILVWYVRQYRPHLLKGNDGPLFPGESGGPKSGGTLGVQISKAVFRYTGLKFNVHLFRHASGKIFLDARPGQYEVVRRVLGHRSIATTTSIYTGAETRAAGQHFAAVIAERRAKIEVKGGRR